ncbi:MAG: hypothetical protein FJZ79_01825 [Chlorobi bacterium]|nr:hypothetical protein [Chlorobiota bacterium]
MTICRISGMLVFLSPGRTVRDSKIDPGLKNQYRQWTFAAQCRLLVWAEKKICRHGRQAQQASRTPDQDHIAGIERDDLFYRNQ